MFHVFLRASHQINEIGQYRKSLETGKSASAIQRINPGFYKPYFILLGLLRFFKRKCDNSKAHVAALLPKSRLTKRKGQPYWMARFVYFRRSATQIRGVRIYPKRRQKRACTSSCTLSFGGA